LTTTLKIGNQDFTIITKMKRNNYLHKNVNGSDSPAVKISFSQIQTDHLMCTVPSNKFYKFSGP